MARLHACLYTISSSAWRIFRVFNFLSVARCPHLPAAITPLPSIGGHLTGRVTCSTFFIFRTTDIKLKCHSGILLMAICLLFRLPVAHPCWTRVSLGLTSRRTNKLDAGCPSGARTQDTAVNSRMLVPTELRGNIRKERRFAYIKALLGERIEEINKENAYGDS